MSDFIGRKSQLLELQELLQLPSSCLVVLQGRRRIGKSRLAEEFASAMTCYRFTGMAPNNEINAHLQRVEFARQLLEQAGVSGLYEDWGDLFTLLAEQTGEGRQVIIFDEISWMGSEDPTFLSKLKTAWDTQFSKNQKLILILCGSVSTWIEKNIMSSTAFMGRPSLYMNLQQLPLHDCNQFYGNYAEQLSTYEKLKLLSITGGVPRYLELVDPKQSAEHNIRRLCFSPSGILLHEFNFIFNDIFGRRSNAYLNIVKSLVPGAKTTAELSQVIGASGGSASQSLKDLVLAGFLSAEPSFNFSTQSDSRLVRYRICDNYLRFYLKFVEKSIGKIQRGQFTDLDVASLPGWYTTLGLQFESLVLNNRNAILKLLDIPPQDILFCGPYFQKLTKRHKACQVDLLIYTRHKVAYVCEIKFSKNPVPFSVIEEVRQRCDSLAKPKNVSVRSVLIHVNGVSERVEDEQYFSKIISFDDLLKKPQ